MCLLSIFPPQDSKHFKYMAYIKPLLITSKAHRSYFYILKKENVISQYTVN